MNGFLVCADRALIAIGQILCIQKEPLFDHQWNVKVYLTGNVSVAWNKEPLTETQANTELKLIRKMFEEATKFS